MAFCGPVIALVGDAEPITGDEVVRIEASGLPYSCEQHSRDSVGDSHAATALAATASAVGNGDRL